MIDRVDEALRLKEIADGFARRLDRVKSDPTWGYAYLTVSVTAATLSTGQGSSYKGYDDLSPTHRQWLTKAIDELKNEIFTRAVEIGQREAHNRVLSAREQARRILELTKDDLDGAPR